MIGIVLLMEQILYDGQLLGTKIASANAPVSALDFCTNSLNLAVGYANARVRVTYFCFLSVCLNGHYIFVALLTMLQSFERM